MSYESKHIDGDVSVGRNTAIGGDATVQGKTHLKGNVMVDGWLEAKISRSEQRTVHDHRKTESGLSFTT